MKKKFTLFLFVGWLVSIFTIQAQPTVQMQKLLASDGASSDYFGESVSMSDNYVILGTPGDDDLGSSAGAAYVFYNNAGTWEQETKLFASDGAASDYLGKAVDISGDYAI